MRKDNLCSFQNLTIYCNTFSNNTNLMNIREKNLNLEDQTYTRQIKNAKSIERAIICLNNSLNQAIRCLKALENPNL